MTAMVVDASVWVARFITTDPYSAACAAFIASQAETGQLLISPAILLPEVCGAISRRTGAPALAERCRDIMLRTSGLRLVSINSRLAEAAAQLALDHGLRGADAIYVAVADLMRIPLISLDREHLEKAGRVVVARRP
jgi:predicted nucleic acid-binding protein